MSRKPELKGRAARLARLLPAGRARAARTPFVLLVVVLLGGGLIGLLVLNSALSEGSFKLADLQKQTKNLTDEEQALQRDIDAFSSPDALQRRARELGMVPGGDPAFLGPDGTVKGVPGAAPEPAALIAPASPGAMTPAGALATVNGVPGAAPEPAAPAAPASPGAVTPAGALATAPPAPTVPSPPQGPPAAPAPVPPTTQPIPTPIPGR
ncbi:septum formation initiator family protein [Streptomyces cyanogenus]|uniref:Cell division protein FtsL n=1 Tax=Streptomyces cyanogenus TaxID=80860 RepID=A0ABX7TMY0_STRCY|nr:septum formation initiator family protein [Streptomyces cyanogenus]QTD97976.1 Cell division protein FtsL [Streptomyces cyanogenus]